MRKKIAVFGVITALSVTSLTGCGLKSNGTIIDKLTGLKSDEMFKIGELKCMTPEYMLVLMNIQNQYKKDLGEALDWNIKLDDNTKLQDFIIEKARDDISLKYALSAMAVENEIVLTHEEQLSIEQAAGEYYNLMSEEEKEYTNATQTDIENLYRNYYLADKAYIDMTKDIGTKISDEEARVIKVQYIHMDTSKNTPKKIKSLMENISDVVNGGYQEFVKEARQYSEDETVEKIIKKNEASDDYEIKAFDLNNGEISKIIQDGEDYYLVYCLESYMKKETDSNKQSMIAKAKQDYFDAQYRTFLDDTYTDFNSKAEKKIKLSDNKNVNNIGLFITYDSIKSEEINN